MSNLANQLVVAEREEVSRSIRTLLARPLLTEKDDPAAFDVVRRRREPLTSWFDYTLGWVLSVEARQGYARLSKVRMYGAEADGSRPARRLRAGRTPFDRRRYVLFCVACAELLSVPVTTVGLLADRVAQALAADDALPGFDTAQRSERMAFVDVLRILESYGAVTTLDGATDSYTESECAKVLYRVQSDVLTRLLAAPGSPSRIAADAPEGEAKDLRFEDLLGELTHERRYGARDGDASAAQHTLLLRHAVLRRLFDDPVLYRDELTHAQLGYVTSLTGRKVMRRAAEQAGFVLEERAEGWLLADPEALATDERFPDDSSHAKIAALLLLDTLSAAGPGGRAVGHLAAEAEGLLARFPAWGKAYRSQEGAARLVEDAVRVLVRFGLVRMTGDRAVARPLAARYRVVGVDQQPARTAAVPQQQGLHADRQQHDAQQDERDER
ncbi:TIGR02678 family protein [Streptomyces sp. NPDC059349]|uniref:TIGR02678 family protein n=1 Tax=Streptomyces sp. NPDC059349 TaxID=3346808 RepID=UPI0036C60E0E